MSVQLTHTSPSEEVVVSICSIESDVELRSATVTGLFLYGMDWLCALATLKSRVEFLLNSMFNGDSGTTLR